MFKKAIKEESKLRMAIAGPSGAGKTYTSLAVGLALANGGKVALVDTEHGSASKYADIFDFDVADMHPPYHPDKFVGAIEEAAKAGYVVVILDSLSHAWNGPGGLLEIVDLASKKFKGNTYAGWSEGTPIQNQLIEAVTGTDIHIIGTMRSKQDYILVERKGKQVPQKVGMAPIQRDGFEYEFDVFLDMDIENNAIVTKTRCPALVNQLIEKPGADLASVLGEWLHGEAVTVTSPDNNQPAETIAEIADVLDTEPEPADNNILDARAWLESQAIKSPKNGMTIKLGFVADALCMTGEYNDPVHVTHAIEGKDNNAPVPAGFKVDYRTNVSLEGGLKIYDWGVGRKADEADKEAA